LNRPLLFVAIGVAAVIAAIALNYTLSEQEKTVPATEQTTPQSTPQAKAVTGPATPTFDVVRVNPQGDTVIAGRARPGSTVVILDNGKPIGEVKADARGEWVFIPKKPLPSGDRKLGLEMRVKGKKPVLSDQIVMLTVPKGADRPLAIMVPRFGKGATTVLQKPGAAAGAFKLSIDAVDYDDAGNLSISGKSAPNAAIQLYLDNAFIGRAKAESGGLWSISPKAKAKPGLYTLRADQVDEKGKVVARVEFPFSLAQPIKGLAPGAFVVVQPGNSLWRLARRTYGAGLSYSIIYKANKKQIKDPNLIYPGQVFSLPHTN
jgi:LysM repeat protein